LGQTKINNIKGELLVSLENCELKVEWVYKPILRTQKRNPNN